MARMDPTELLIQGSNTTFSTTRTLPVYIVKNICKVNQPCQFVASNKVMSNRICNFCFVLLTDSVNLLIQNIWEVRLFTNLQNTLYGSLHLHRTQHACAHKEQWPSQSPRPVHIQAQNTTTDKYQILKIENGI